ncbi:ABC transporter substrate-binding protein [Lederbergia galactosidilytica]|uniref:ABC transporter substrate-binding protein n=1 Tax=Lederbergia galactosidilytica TaxID=217031 RepID=A0A0Q9Y471_9BACI|nr:extracellular solute-binding protein [Lederbergia galactosidilytica]KRG11748.1 ABC transporter substrate-binding protein [Lederbergia galactosidilytica]OAK71381.1 ABC transporter substrate-binding protein [Lederbergia galactosidilytica]
MKKSKFLFLLLCFLLFVFAACSNGTVNSNPNNGAADSGEDQDNETEQQKEKDYYQTPEMDFDMGGKTIKWVSWYDEAIQEDNPDSIQKKEKLDALMKKHNFQIEYVIVDYAEYADKVTSSLLAGQPIGDIIRLARPWMIPTLTKQDLFWSVDEYTDNDHVFLQHYTDNYSQFEGKGYGFRAGILGASSGIFYNRTLMDSLGISPIQGYVNEDNWNWETFIEVAKKANKDTNNDGKLDTWGLATASLLVQALAANDANLAVENKQNLEDQKTIEALNFLSQLATEDVARPTEGGDWTEPAQFFREGNTLMYAGSDYEMNSFNEDMPDYDIGFLPFPKGPSAKGYSSHNTIPNYLTIPKTVEHPEQLLYIYEKMNDIESIYDYPQQNTFETLFSNEEDIENAKMAGETINVIDKEDAYPNLPFYDFQGEILEGTSVTTVVEKYKEPFQSAIDEVWKQ